MPIGTITISVQLGSGGFALARSVAEQLGFRYYDWEITSQAAEMAGVSPEIVAAADRVPGFIERMMRRLSAAPVLSPEEAVLEPAPAMVGAAVQSLTSDDYRSFVDKVVREISGQGDAVIVGHAAQAILRDQPGVIKVLVVGSVGRRAERLAIEQSVTAEQAAATIRQSDKDRAELFRRIYHIDWLDASLYDLCLNTDNVPNEIGAEAIVTTVRRSI